MGSCVSGTAVSNSIRLINNVPYHFRGRGLNIQCRVNPDVFMFAPVQQLIDLSLFVRAVYHSGAAIGTVEEEGVG